MHITRSSGGHFKDEIVGEGGTVEERERKRQREGGKHKERDRVRELCEGCVRERENVCGQTHTCL